MAAWDPFGDPCVGLEETEGATSQDPTAESPKPEHGYLEPKKQPAVANAETIGGVQDIVSRVMQQLQAEKPWSQIVDQTPDLTWHTPTCTSKDWKHTDVKFEVSDGIAYVIFNRPKENNYLNYSLSMGLNDALFELHTRKDIRVVVFTGEGPMYCAGGDPKAWQQAAAMARGEKIAGDTNTMVYKDPTPEVVASIEGMIRRATSCGAFPDGNVEPSRILAAKQWHTWQTLPQFTICLVNGSAMGGGVGCVCCCDMAIALKKAFFSLSEVKLGVIPATISPYVVAKIGTSNAKRLFCTAENLTAERAKEIGIVNEVVQTKEEGHALIKRICESISAAAPQAVSAAKRLVVAVAGQPINETLMFYTGAELAKVTVGEEAKDGMIAIQAKEPPPWAKCPIKPKY